MNKSELEVLPNWELYKTLRAKGEDTTGLDRDGVIAKLSGKPKAKKEVVEELDSE